MFVSNFVFTSLRLDQTVSVLHEVQAPGTLDTACRVETSPLLSKNLEFFEPTFPKLNLKVKVKNKSKSGGITFTEAAGNGRIADGIVEADSASFVADSSRSPDSIVIFGHFDWKVKVNNCFHIFDVDPAADHVCRHQDRCFALFKA